MANYSEFGWDILLKSVEPPVENEKDALVLFVHWNLVKNQILCLGTGDEKELSENEVGTELIPHDWKSNEKYSLRYKFNGELYLFFMVPSGDTLVFNLLKASDLTLSSFACGTNTVISLNGTLSSMFEDYKQLLYSIKKNLLEFVLDKQTTSTHVQTVVEPQNSFPIRPPNPEFWNYPGREPLTSSADYGIGDLNPLLAGYGGNLFSIPHRPENRMPLPRHDPILPFPPSRPNNDHFRMPRFGDDDII